MSTYLGHLRAEGRSPHTLRRYRPVWRDWLAPSLGRRRLDDLRHKAIEAALVGMAKHAQSPISIRQAATILNGRYAWTIATGRAIFNPMAHARLPDGTRIRGARRRGGRAYG